MKNGKLKFTVAVMISILLVFLGACGDSSGGKSSTGTSEKSSADASKKNQDLNLKDAVVGFSQSEKLTNPFRVAESDSIKSEAKKEGVKKLIVTNAQSSADKQVSDIRDLISQGVDILIVAPLQATGLQSVFKEASKKDIPIFLIDRETAGTSGKDFVTFMGSDFYKQGQKAAKALAKATKEKGKVAILKGSIGASVTNDRTKGFQDAIKNYPDMKVVANQSGDFVRSKGQKVTEQLLSAHSDISALYSENDEMALGAISAIKSAGLTPGKDVKVVSIDGTKEVMKNIENGKIYADVQTNPRFGPLAFKTIKKYLSGKDIPKKIINKDQFYNSDNVKDALQKGLGY